MNGQMLIVWLDFYAGLQSLKPCGNKNKKADKVFLGNGKNGGLNLQSATILTGVGQCRTDGLYGKSSVSVASYPRLQVESRISGLMPTD
ncbi:TPA: hypothetical protein G8V61_004122 [Salmonella enterica]|nr:hypothetical protein [Salmonella enterica]